jgi:hypothetical protein
VPHIADDIPNASFATQIKGIMTTPGEFLKGKNIGFYVANSDKRHYIRLLEYHNFSPLESQLKKTLSSFQQHFPSVV